MQLLVACKPRDSREIKPQVPASLHCLEHFFTLSHTLPLHDSHLNTRFLNAVLQANMSQNKANTWLIKFNLTSLNQDGKMVCLMGSDVLTEYSGSQNLSREEDGLTSPWVRSLGKVGPQGVKLMPNRSQEA